MGELYAKVSSQTLTSAISELVLAKIITFEGNELAGYLRDRAKNARIIALWQTNRAWLLKEGPSQSIRAILAWANCFYNDSVARGLGQLVCSIRVEDFDGIDIPKDSVTTLKGLRKYTGIGIPCWEGSRLVGFWLIQDRCWQPNGYAFLPVQEHRFAIGFGHAIGMEHDSCFITNDPKVALRFMSRQLLDCSPSTRPVPFLVPAGDRDTRNLIPCRNIYYVPCSSVGMDVVAWYRRAIRLMESQTVPEWKLKFLPQNQWPPGVTTSRGLLNGLKDLAMPAHQALGAYLLTRPKQEAGRVAQSFELTLGEQNQVLAYFNGSDHEFLTDIFETDTKLTSIALDGDIITETRDGWSVNDTLICEAIVRIDELRTDSSTGESTITGTVIIRNRVLPFSEPLSVIQRNPGAWLDRFCRVNGEWPKINQRWNQRLLDVAKAFSADRMSVVASDKPFGWGQDSVLRFPRFLIDHTGVSRADSRVLGPDVPPPAAMTGQDWSAFVNADFCMLALALLGNLARTWRGSPGLGIVVPSSPHVVERIAGAFDIDVTRNPSLALVGQHANQPLPCFGHWADEHLVGLLQNRSACHAMLSVDTRTFRLMASLPGWLRLPVDGVSGYEALRWIFHALPTLLATDFSFKEDSSFYRDMAKYLIPDVGRHQAGHKLVVAATDLDNNLRLCQASAGTTILRLLRNLADAGQLPVTPIADGIEIEHKDVIAAFASPVMPQVDIPRLTRHLFDGGMLIGSKQGHWVITLLSWELVGHLDRMSR